MFNLTNPFRRADKHGGPDMRVTAPASAETPMLDPECRIWIKPVGECPPINSPDILLTAFGWERIQ